MIQRHRQISARCERGQALVEFAGLLPVLALLLFGIIQFGIVFHDYIAVTDASRVGARKAAVSRFVENGELVAENAALQAADSLNGGGLAADCTSTNWNTPGSDVSCTVTYPYSIDVLGLVVAEGELSSVTTERLE
jgi:Flp pilus assembly protein TadG